MPHKQLIINDKSDYQKSLSVLGITHYGIFNTTTVADYELKM